jgi:flagellar biosynthesis protein
MERSPNRSVLSHNHTHGGSPPRRSHRRQMQAYGRTQAVALTYDSTEMPAPTVSAAGQGEVAERIIALANEHGIPIRQDPDLVALLAQLDVGQIIPPELYAVVAEVLAFVYQLKGKQAHTLTEPIDPRSLSR